MRTRSAATELMATSAAAFAAVLPEIEALPSHRVLPNDVHVASVAVEVIMAVPAIEEVIAANGEIPPHFDLAKIHRLKAYAGATWHAYVQSFEVNASLIEGLGGEAFACRGTLLGCATVLAKRGWLRKGPVRAIGNKAGTQALAHDVLELAEMLCDAWPRPEALGVEGWHLARASAIGLDLLIALSLRSHVPERRAEETCARALSVLAYVYEECRELIGRLRANEGDLDDIAPPIGVPNRPEANTFDNVPPDSQLPTGRTLVN